MTSERRKHIDEIQEEESLLIQLKIISHNFLNNFMEEFNDLDATHQIFIFGRAYADLFLTHSSDIESFELANKYLYKSMKSRLSKMANE